MQIAKKTLCKGPIKPLEVSVAIQRSNFISKAASKIIAETEAKKTFALAVPQQFFCQCNQTNLCI